MDNEYGADRYPGVCFELKDVEDYDEEWDKAAGWRYGTTFISIADLRNAGGDFPKAYVTKALAEGKPVPAYVLASYPDLVLKHGHPVENTPQARLRQGYPDCGKGMRKE